MRIVKLIVNILLVVAIVFFAYLLIASIREPIMFKAAKERREQAVIEKLIKIRKAQEAYRGVTGEFAGSFDTLKDVLTTGNFKLIKVIGDPDDPNFTGEITYDTILRPAIDSIRKMDIVLDSLPYVPYGKGAKFMIAADTTSYQKTLVNVVEVKVQRKVFMGKYDSTFAKYDDRYDPSTYLKFGSMDSPKLAGNWE